jgi:hypothetical protein
MRKMALAPLLFLFSACVIEGPVRVDSPPHSHGSECGHHYWHGGWRTGHHPAGCNMVGWHGGSHVHTTGCGHFHYHGGWHEVGHASDCGQCGPVHVHNSRCSHAGGHWCRMRRTWFSVVATSCSHCHRHGPNCSHAGGHWCKAGRWETHAGSGCSHCRPVVHRHLGTGKCNCGKAWYWKCVKAFRVGVHPANCQSCWPGGRHRCRGGVWVVGLKVRCRKCR